MEIKDTCLYIHTRKSDGGIFYVGIGNEKRPYDKNNRNRFWKYVVNKHGFEVTILKTDMSWKESCDIEIKMIAFYGRKNIGFGCLVNMTDGGDGAKGVVKTDEQKQKIRERMTGKKNHMFGKTGEKNHMFGKTGENHPLFGSNRSDEQKLKMSGENHPMFGKKCDWLVERNKSDKSRQKRREQMIGEKNPMFGKSSAMAGRTGENHPTSIKIICIITNKIYSSIKEASEDNRVNLNTLRGYLRGNRPNKTSLRYL